MILICRADSVPQFSDYLKALVEQENALGERLVYEKLLTRIMAGKQNLVLIYEKDDDTEPLLMLVLGENFDPVREEKHLIIDNIYVPNKERLAAYGFESEKERFLDYCKPYAKVYFWTRNKAVVQLTERLGLFFDPTSIMYELRR